MRFCIHGDCEKIINVQYGKVRLLPVHKPMAEFVAGFAQEAHCFVNKKKGNQTDSQNTSDADEKELPVPQRLREKLSDTISVIMPDAHERRNRNIAVILAGGKSGRNRQNLPSQFINVKGKPILVYCMDTYQVHPSVDDIYVVCLRGWENIVRAYAEQYGITKLRGIIPGGNSGILSLKNALDHISTRYAPEDLVIIQESTRPLITTETVSKLLLACQDKDSATICHSMDEYVQFSVSPYGTRYIDRNTTIALQSPEAHRLSLMKEVFAQAARMKHALTETCCTMLLYNLGYKINFIEGGINNIKIVREEDIAAFSAIVK